MRLKFQLAPNRDPHFTGAAVKVNGKDTFPASRPRDITIDSANISELLQAAGLNVEVIVNHDTGECSIAWGAESQSAQAVVLSAAQRTALNNIIRSMPEYLEDL